MAKERQITEIRLPNYLSRWSDWQKWRVTYEGGVRFRDTYLKQFTSREDANDYAARKDITPIPSFAKSAINDIRNSIFQRMVDIVRRDGSDAYHQAANGMNMGVDRRGSTMNAFIGVDVLEELLVMGQTGIFIDAPQIGGPVTLADAGMHRPYLYSYKVEDILSYACTNPDQPSEFRSLLLRDRVMEYDQRWGLPDKEEERYRHLWIENGQVHVQLYDSEGDPIGRDGLPSGPVALELDRIPFVLVDIGESLLLDVCEYQIALLNLISSDVNYALLANFPFYVEQRDMRKVGGHLKEAANPDGTATQGGQGAHVSEIKTGVTQGRAYPIGAERPGFIHPSSEPLKASIELQEKMERDIRKLVNLAVQTLASRQSAEAKSMDNQGLESGLSYIGLKLQSAEQQIAHHWAAYESKNPHARRVATIKYPDRYSLKTDFDRIEEAEKLSKVIRGTPSRTAQKELWKTNVVTLLGGKVNPDVIAKIFSEIDQAKFTTSDPETIIEAKEAGLVGEKVASIALGFDPAEYLQARQDHLDRIKRIAETQGVIDQPAGARGVDDLSANPNDGREEKKRSRDTDLRDSTEDRVRGEGKRKQEE